MQTVNGLLLYCVSCGLDFPPLFVSKLPYVGDLVPNETRTQVETGTYSTI